ncbi:hypothetical protein X975_01395, partial [Stegodyphus mimosarum]
MIVCQSIIHVTSISRVVNFTNLHSGVNRLVCFEIECTFNRLDSGYYSY